MLTWATRGGGGEGLDVGGKGGWGVYVSGTLSILFIYTVLFHIFTLYTSYTIHL